MKKMTATQAGDLLFAIVCLVLSLILLCMHEYVIDINPKDNEYIGLLGTGAFGFFVTALVFSIKSIRSYRRSN